MATSPTYPQVVSQAEGWDATLETWRQILQNGPLPLVKYTGLGTLPAASQNEGCMIMYRPNSGAVYRHAYSSGVKWIYTNGENEILV